MAQVCVTGGSGRLGNSLVRALLAQGHAVRVLEPGQSVPRSLEGLDIELVYGSVLDRNCVEQAIGDASVVYHLAAKVDLDRDLDGSVMAVNVEGTRHVAEVCLNKGIRMVHTSSHHALVLEPLSEPLDESKPLALDHKCFYHRSKALAEKMISEMVQTRGLNAVIVSPGTLIGPHDYEPSMIGQGLIDLAKGKLPAMLGVTTDCADARDVAAAMIQAAEHGRKGERYLLSGPAAPMRKLAQQWSEITGCKVPRLFLPLWTGWLFIPFTVGIARLRRQKPLFTANMLRASVANDVIDISKAQRELAYKPRPRMESLQDMFNFYCKLGWLEKT
ncbi:MAG: NAD-dependent epimerase/dehydratase family protein [Nevskiales bacterium]